MPEKNLYKTFDISTKKLNKPLRPISHEELESLRREFLREESNDINKGDQKPSEKYGIKQVVTKALRRIRVVK